MGDRGNRKKGSGESLWWIYGYRPVLEALDRDPASSKRLLVSHRRKQGVQELFDRARKAKINPERVPAETLDELFQGANHQGVGLQTTPFAYQNFEQWLERVQTRAKGQWPRVLVLDQVQDAGNVGAMIRSAVACGVDGLILPERKSALITPAVLRASAGMARQMPVMKVVNVARALAQLQSQGFWVAGAGTRGGKVPWSVDLTGPLALVMGSEAKGMRRLVEESCDYMLTVPLSEGAESLNVSAAAAMLMYELVRQEEVWRAKQGD